ncbi:unnamed protein product [Closterium sp. NIES-64]|nr:unnamed protein product [Closterium sp. NIES-64]
MNASAVSCGRAWEDREAREDGRCTEDLKTNQRRELGGAVGNEHPCCELRMRRAEEAIGGQRRQEEGRGVCGAVSMRCYQHVVLLACGAVSMWCCQHVVLSACGAVCMWHAVCM